jgi:chorismate--pyruvate lyase
LKHAGAFPRLQKSAASARNLQPEILSWLCDQGSLTQRLVDLCGDHFSVRVLSQQWLRPTKDEARLLKIPARQIVLLRQVQLLCEQQVLVYARSVIPLHTLRGPTRRLKYLGNKPLGGYLFANPSLRRQQQQLLAVTRNNPLFATVLSGSSQDCSCVWSRRSLFTLDAKSLLVSEYFLPALFQK